MNIQEKIVKARIDLQALNLKKTGKNQNISYYELGDFLPAVNQLAGKYEFYTKFKIVTDQGQEKAILTVSSLSDSKEREAYIIPTAEVSLPHGQAIQSLGAKITYLRRYLLMIAFEIAESDLTDSIKRDLTEEVSEKDQEEIKNAKTLAELTKVCGELKTKYKISLITPLYDEAKVKLEQDGDAKVIKKELK